MILATALCCDFKTWKIHNEIIFWGLAAGIYYAFVQGTYAESFLGALFPLLLLPLFHIRALGAGDIKLLCVAGSFYGFTQIPAFLIVTLFFAGILSTIQVIRYGNLSLRFQYFFCYISNYLKTKEYYKYYDAGCHGREPVIHFSLAIFLAHLFFVLQTG